MGADGYMLTNTTTPDGCKLAQMELGFNKNTGYQIKIIGYKK